MDCCAPSELSIYVSTLCVFVTLVGESLNLKMLGVV